MIYRVRNRGKLPHGEIAPADHILHAHGNDGKRFNRHRVQLPVAPAQERLGARMLGPTRG
jgi:hypothetical protein